ncbi:MAG: hypothetical protein U9N61_02860, partial [Euryarchaeota archaeon]|nr:hypothetical protein [Euryarchaeota archaeon]
MKWMFFALILDRVQLKLTAGAYKYSPFRSGYAIIDKVLQRDAYAPMAYRWLMPLLASSKKGRFVWVYEPLKIGMMAFSMWAASLILGVAGGLALGLMYCMTFWTDYWDVYIEVGAYALALTGQVELALLGAILLGLSRETAPLVGIIYALVTGDIGGGLQLIALSSAILLIIRLYVGKKKLYCERFMWRQNIRDVKDIFENHPFYLGEITMTLITTALTIIAILQFPPGWPVCLVLLLAGWLMGRAAETRIFAGCFLWIIP